MLLIVRKSHFYQMMLKLFKWCWSCPVSPPLPPPWMLYERVSITGSGAIHKVGGPNCSSQKWHRRRNDFQSEGAGFFWKSRMAHQRWPSRLRDAGRCLRGDVPPSEVGAFFENVGSNEVIWCTIFHHVKHLTACLLRCFFYFRTGWSKKWRGHAPPVWKVEGPLAPRFRRLFKMACWRQQKGHNSASCRACLTRGVGVFFKI